MTQEQFDQAKALIEKRDYFRQLYKEVLNAKSNKILKDMKAEREPDTHSNKWLLSRFFTIHLLTDKNTNKNIVGVQPHWEFAHTIDIEADWELLELILEWLLKKTNEYDKKIQEI